jgi:TolB-like protein
MFFRIGSAWGTVLPLLVTVLAATAVFALPGVLQGQEKKNPPPTVAVLYFDYTGKTTDLEVLRKGLAQMMITDLIDIQEIQVVERDRLQDILEELKLAQTAKVDPQTAAKVGKLLGARYLVLGAYFDLAQTFRVDARVVEVETGKVMKSFGTNGKADEFLLLEQKLVGDLRNYFQTDLWSDVTKPQPDPARPKTERPKPPKTLKSSTAVAYSKALDAKDKGEVEVAKAELKKVVEEQPDFTLAVLDLKLLAQ